MDDAMYRLHADYEEVNWWFVAKNRIILSLLHRYLGAGAEPGDGRPRVCDIGCGCGGLLVKLVQCYDAAGMDMSPIALEYCARRGLNALPGSLPDDVPYDAGSFDAVVASEVLEHVAEDEQALRAIARIVRPGGLVIATVPAFQWMWSRHDELNHHCRRYNKAAFAALFDRAGLQRVRLTYYNTCLFPLMVTVRMASRLRDARGTRAKTPGTPVEAEAPGFRPPPAPINALFRTLFAGERHLVPRIGLPFGGSLIAVYRKA